MHVRTHTSWVLDVSKCICVSVCVLGHIEAREKHWFSYLGIIHIVCLFEAECLIGMELANVLGRLFTLRNPPVSSSPELGYKTGLMPCSL